MTAVLGDLRLSAGQVEQFHRDGYLGPFALCEVEEMERLRPEIDRVLQHEAPPRLRGHDVVVVGQDGHDNFGHNRHLDCEVIWRIASSPAIVERMKCILGEDLLLWRTNFFSKPPGEVEVPWHQDYHYWPIEPAVVVSAWVAIDDANRENGCVEIIPGSHRHLRPHVASPDGMWFSEMADPETFDASEKIEMPLRPGEFFLFNERTLHHSEPNRSDRRRCGMSVRVIPPQTRVLEYDAELHELIQLCGSDPLGFNRVVDHAPTT